MYNYTVVIPHYRSEKSLERLLISIPDRNDIQIVVVDDNSKLDKSAFSELPLYHKANFNIIFMSNNKGAGGARNEGLKSAKGKWLLFADADDFFLPNAFDIFDKYSTSDCDIIYFKSNSICSETNLISDRGDYYNNLIDNYIQQNKNAVQKLKYNHGVPWCKMIKKCIVDSNNLHFEEIKYSNDVMFSTKLGYYSTDIMAADEYVYCVTKTNGSLTTIKNIDSLECRYRVALRQNKFLRDHGLAKYQKSIMSYLRISLKYGLSTLIRFIRIGRENKADFSVGMMHWHEFIIRKL